MVNVATKKPDNSADALRALVASIKKGREFPDAAFAVAQKFGVNQSRLEKAYDALYQTNPIKRTGVSAKKYVARPSQITQSAPSKRLKARRKENLNAGETGFFPNPASSSRAAFLNERVKLLAKLCKLPTQDQYPKIGALLLNKVHGARYQITQVTSAGGAESDLSGTLTISEMEEWLSGAITIADARFKSV